ncbi:hemolysin family protein [Desulfobacca acetoxidans]
MIILLYVTIFLLLLFLEGFFTSSEIALVSANHRQLQHLAENGQRQAILAQKLLRAPERLFATTLLGSNLAETANTVLVSALLIDIYGRTGEAAAMLALPPIILLFAEILPKSIARLRPTRMAQKVSFFVWLASILLAPITWFFASFSRLILLLTGVRSTSLAPFVTREELKMVVKASGAEVDLDTEERTIIHRILYFSQTTVKEVMIPLIEVLAIPETYLISQALEEFRRGRFSRLPVYRHRIDNIIGILHSFDLLGAENPAFGIKKLIRPARFVPVTKRADRLLVEMQQEGIHLVIVVDEYGGAVGIVALEDLLEEVVGDIADEFDQEISPFQKLRDGAYLINARMEIEAVNENLGLNLPLGNYHTLGGFLIKQVGDIPRTGERIRYRNLLFIIRLADLRAIKEVEVHVEASKTAN